MMITNIKAFAGKDVTFNGESIPKDYAKKGMPTSAGITICVEKNGCTYTCTPSI